jgi:hypothetical protein
MLHIKITHFNSVASVVITSVKCRILTISVANIILPSSYVVSLMTSQGHLRHLQRLVYEEKSSDEEYKAFSMKKTTQKSFLEANTPLPTVRECQCSLAFFGGVLQHSVHPSGGALVFLGKFWAALP